MNLSKAFHDQDVGAVLSILNDPRTTLNKVSLLYALGPDRAFREPQIVQLLLNDARYDPRTDRLLEEAFQRAIWLVNGDPENDEFPQEPAPQIFFILINDARVLERVNLVHGLSLAVRWGISTVVEGILQLNLPPDRLDLTQFRFPEANQWKLNWNGQRFMGSAHALELLRQTGQVNLAEFRLNGIDAYGVVVAAIHLQHDVVAQELLNLVNVEDPNTVRIFANIIVNPAFNVDTLNRWMHVHRVLWADKILTPRFVNAILHFATAESRLDLVDALLGHPNVNPTHAELPLALNSTYDNRPTLQAILQRHGVDSALMRPSHINKEDTLIEALSGRDWDRAQRLLDLMDPHQVVSYQMFMFLAQGQDLEPVLFLLHDGRINFMRMLNGMPPQVRHTLFRRLVDTGFPVVSAYFRGDRVRYLHVSEEEYLIEHGMSRNRGLGRAITVESQHLINNVRRFG
jgi:hypothetical protein